MELAAPLTAPLAAPRPAPPMASIGAASCTALPCALLSPPRGASKGFCPRCHCTRVVSQSFPGPPPGLRGGKGAPKRQPRTAAGGGWGGRTPKAAPHCPHWKRMAAAAAAAADLTLTALSARASSTVGAQGAHTRSRELRTSTIQSGRAHPRASDAPGGSPASSAAAAGIMMCMTVSLMYALTEGRAGS